jgi:signal peptidase
MSRPRLWRHPTTWAVVGLGLLCWFLFAPAALGGPASYVIVDGSSMEPTLHEGDLVLLHEVDHYVKGDLIAFRVDVDGSGKSAVVIHRIVRRIEPTDPSSEARFVTQGDNNPYLDLFQPRERDVMGKRLVRVPGLGRLVTKARENPVPTAVVVAGAAALPAAAEKKRRRGGDERLMRRGPAGRPPGKATAVVGVPGQVAVAVIGGVALISLALGALAFTRPTTESISTPIGYQHSGSFGYRAPAQSVYADGVANTGEPVYRRATDEVAFRFDYRLDGGPMSDVGGTLGLAAVLSLPDGWSRSIPLGEQQSFTGTSASANAILSLESLDRVIARLEDQAGVMPGQVYGVAVAATVDVQGTVGGAAFHDTFSPELSFQLSSVELQMAAAGSSQQDPLEPTKSGSVDRTETRPTSLDLLGVDLRVDIARQAAFIGFVAFAIGGLVLLVMLWLSSKADEPSRIARRYRQMLITRADGETDGWGRVIELASMEDLARIASRDGSMIVHQEGGAVHEYYVSEGQVTYRYRAAERSRASHITPAAPKVSYRDPRGS